MHPTPSPAERKAETRAVLFDAGNTLLRVTPSVGRVYAAVAARHGVEADGAEIERLFRAEFERRRGSFVAAVSRPHGQEKERAWWKALVEAVFEDAGLRERFGRGFDPFFEDVYRTFERPEVWEVFPDVGPCLDALAARGLPLGVVSNWDSRLHPVLRGLGLARYFRFALTSAEVGAEKPDAPIFEEAARRFGLPPEQILHVGDLLRDDVEGARAAGLRALLLDRACGPRSAEAERVCSLREVPDRLFAGP